MNVNSNLSQLDLPDQRAVWLSRNKGIVTQVAEELGVSVKTVYVVLHHKERSARIEARLADLGAPGFPRE